MSQKWAHRRAHSAGLAWHWRGEGLSLSKVKSFAKLQELKRVLQKGWWMASQKELWCRNPMQSLALKQSESSFEKNIYDSLWMPMNAYEFLWYMLLHSSLSHHQPLLNSVLFRSWSMNEHSPRCSSFGVQRCALSPLGSWNLHPDAFWTFDEDRAAGFWVPRGRQSRVAADATVACGCLALVIPCAKFEMTARSGATLLEAFGGFWLGSETNRLKQTKQGHAWLRSWPVLIISGSCCSRWFIFVQLDRAQCRRLEESPLEMHSLENLPS